MIISKIAILALSVTLFASSSLSQHVSGRFSTSVYALERFDSVGTSRDSLGNRFEHSYKFIRGYENFDLDGEYGNLSFHTDVHGALNLSNSFGDEAQLRVYNAYLRVKNIAHVAELIMGRIPIFAGVANGVVDGVLLRVHGWNEIVILTGFAGASVTSDLRSNGTHDLNNNFSLGGQIIVNPLVGARVGVSYMNRHRMLENYLAVRPDSLFNSVTQLVSPGTRTEQMLGVDAHYNFPGRHYVYGRYDYDLDMKHLLRGEFDGKVFISHRLSLTGAFIYREPHIFANSFFALFPLAPVKEYEGGAEYTLGSSLSAYGRFAFVLYEGDRSKRLTAGVNARYGSIQYSGSEGYAGQLSSFSIQGMYPVLDYKLTPTVGFSYATYRLLDGSADRRELFTGSLGAIIRPIQSVSFDGQLQWLRNMIALNDIRGFVQVSYWFSHRFSQLQEKQAGE